MAHIVRSDARGSGLEQRIAVMAAASLLFSLWGLYPGSSMAAEVSPRVAAIIAGADRQGDRGADARRHPGELVEFSGLSPGDKVLELIPGSGYFTRIFSRVVGQRGRVYAVWPAPYAAVAHPDPETLYALSQTAGFGNIRVSIQPADRLSAPEPLDVVFTSQNYHDYPDKFMGSQNPSVLNDAVYRALKPGGVYIVVDHVAEGGSGLRDTDTLHRIDPAVVKQQVVAAGFVFEGALDVLRNPADPHTVKVFDPSVRGRTDQFVFKFRKPRKLQPPR